MATRRKPVMPKAKWPKDSRIKHQAEVYRAKDGWRWRLWAKNGRIVAESGESYRSKYRCSDMILSISCGFGCLFMVDGEQEGVERNDE
jgi:uncharacterized protein YegP (UPF0339 family)